MPISRSHQLHLRIRELESALVSDDSHSAATAATNVPNVKLDSHNSSAPPSLDPPWDKPKRTRSLRKKSNKPVGGQFGHRGVTLLAVSNPDSVIAHSLDVCPNCQSVLSHIDPIRFHKRQVFDVQDGRLFVTEHRVLLKSCPHCKTVPRSHFPSDVNAPVQYGIGARSKSLYLHLYQLIPLARTSEAMRDLFACPMSRATIQRAARSCAAKLVRCEQRIKNAVRDSAVIGVDETGIRVGGVVNWVHVARTNTLTHFASHPRRGKVAFETIGIIPRFRGTLVRDGWLSYTWYNRCCHSLCNAHLLRDLTFVAEAYPAHKSWTSDFAKLLIAIKDAVALARSKSQAQLKTVSQNRFLRRYDAIIAIGLAQTRASPFRKTNQLSPASLLRRLITSKSQVLRFMTDFAVPFDTGGAERDLRMLKLQQKISGCFRTNDGATTFCRIRSYLYSARKQGRSLLTAIERAVNGKPVTLTAAV